MKGVVLFFLGFFAFFVINRPLSQNYREELVDTHLANKDLLYYSTNVDITFTVVETILVQLSGTCRVDFQESFCNGRAFTVIDNDVEIVTIETGAPHFCGVNTSSYVPIISPTFALYSYSMTAGFHNLTVVTVESPLLDRTSSLRITFFPDDTVKMNIIANIKRSTPSPK